jgi:hypothetical protein
MSASWSETVALIVASSFESQGQRPFVLATTPRTVPRATALAMSGITVSALALYFGCALAAWRLRQLGVAEPGMAIRVPLGAVAPWLACVVIIWLLTGLARDEWLAFGACVVAASLLYVVMRAVRQGR